MDEHSEAAASAPPEALRVLLCGTGSVASVKIPALVRMLSATSVRGRPVHVRVVMTDHAMAFVKPEEMPADTLRDEHEWKMWEKMGDPVLHIELRRWADLMVIAPLDANTLGKLASGICDNLITCVARAWDMHKPFIVCPAMNTFMWDHPLTSKQLREIEGFGIKVVPPVVKTLACGDTGSGALAHVETIVASVAEALAAAAPQGAL